MKTTGLRVVKILLAAGVLMAGSMAHGTENVLSFNGTSARVTVLHAAHLSALNAITAEIWFKTATAKNQMPISKFNNNNQEWFIQLLANGTTVRIGILTTKDFTLPARYDDDAWHHLAMTYDGAQIEVFYDGVSLGTQAHTARILPPQQYGRVQLDPVRIGSGMTDWFAGQLAEARIWNVARSELKIRADMHRRLPGDLPGLVGYWRLDKGTGTTVVDQTPFGINGTITSATWSTADLDLSGFVVADCRVNGLYYTGSNEVSLIRFPVPQGYTDFQITENDNAGALGAWASTSTIPNSVTFSQPTANTNVMLYAWFTNTSASVALARIESRIVFTDVTPSVQAHEVLRPFRRLAPGGVVTVSGQDLDNGSTGGEQNGRRLAIAAWSAICDGTPDCDTSPTTPGVTLNQPGSYALRLIVTNEAGNAAQAAAASDVTVVQSNEIYVSAEGDNSAGTSWATALTNVQWNAGLAGIQSIFDLAHNDTTILLAGGTYPIGERLEWSQSNLVVRGGYAGIGSPGARDPKQWPSILTRDTAIAIGIAGQRLGGLALEGALDGWLEGVTLQNGYTYCAGAWVNDKYVAADSYFMPGGNLLIRDSRRVTVTDCDLADGFISANYAPCHGAGVAVVTSEAILLDNCRVLRNSAYANRAYTLYDGGIQGLGLYSANSSLTVTNSLIQENFMTSVSDAWDVSGAGIYVAGGELRLLDTIIAGNNALGRGDRGLKNQGGGMALVGGTHRIWNSRIVLNAMDHQFTPYDYYGSGLHVSGATLSIENSTIAQNTGQGIYSRNTALGITNSIVWGHHKDLDVDAGIIPYFCNLGDAAYAGTNGCIAVEPQFERGFRLAPGSECLNAGGWTPAQAGLAGRTTRADGTPDTDTVDLGYHWRTGLDPAVAELYVATTGDDEADGTSGAPLKTVTEALDRADHGTRIHLAAGTYSRTSNGESFPLAIVNKHGIELLGTNAAVTIIDQERPIPPKTSLNRWRVLTLQHTGGGTRIEGVTLARGWSSHSLYYGTPGGGIGATFSDFSLVSCVLTNNFSAWATGSGGGLYAKGSKVRVTDTGVFDNENDSDWESYGAGIHVIGDSQITVIGCRIANNKTHARQGDRNIKHHGAGVCISHVGQRWGGYTAVINSEIVGNFFSGLGDQFGAGLASLNGNLLLRNCLISGNKGNHDPAKTLVTGGVYIRGGTARIENCTVVDNEAEGLGQYAANAPIIEVVNTIVDGHTNDIGNLAEAMFDHSCASNLTAGVQDNINADPAFVDAVGGNYRLTLESAITSPCFNAGTTLDWMADATDLAGERRIRSGRVDMGAYEAVPPASTLLILR